MKNYKITVNGIVYDVAVEEVGAAGTSAPAAYHAPASAVPESQKTAPSQPAQASSAGGIKISAPMPGKILAIKTSVGASVKKGEVLFILEAMKMENEIVAPQDGTVASVNVNEGQTVEAGILLASLN